MIEVDISNVWCGLSLPDLLAVEKDIAAAHETLTRETDPEESQTEESETEASDSAD